MKLRASLATLIFLSLVVGDQIIKYLVKTGMSLGERIHVTDWFYLLFTENHGMAFGMDFIGTAVLSVFRVVAIGFFTFVLVKQIRRGAPLGFVACLSLIIAGAFGNIIDNFFYGLCFTESLPYTLGAAPAHCVPMGEGYGSFLHGRVVDMFYFPFFTWPDWVPVLGGGTFFGAIFNLADSASSCSIISTSRCSWAITVLPKFRPSRPQQKRRSKHEEAESMCLVGALLRGFRLVDGVRSRERTERRHAHRKDGRRAL